MADPPIPAFHVMAKPTGARCNLRCDYCFFLEKERAVPGQRLPHDERGHGGLHPQTAQAQRVPQVTLAWQGGEPTLMGLDFFRRAVAWRSSTACRRHGRSSTRSRPTGCCWTTSGARSSREDDFLVGLSLDGPRELHDAYRPTRRAGSSDKVVAAARRLRKHGAEFNVL